MAPKQTKTNRNKRLAALRARRGLTQTDMGKMLGLSIRQYQNIEAGAAMSGPVKILVRLMEEHKY